MDKNHPRTQKREPKTGLQVKTEKVPSSESVRLAQEGLIKQGGFTMDTDRGPVTLLMQMDTELQTTDPPNKTMRKMGYNAGVIETQPIVPKVRVDFIRSQDDKGTRLYAADLSDAQEGMADAVLEQLQLIDEFEKNFGDLPPEYLAARTKLRPIADAILASRDSLETTEESESDRAEEKTTTGYDITALQNQEPANNQRIMDSLVRRYGNKGKAWARLGKHGREQYRRLKKELEG